MEDEIAEVVSRWGWYAANISDHNPPFVYTIGLMQSCEHPEFIMFGLDAENVTALFAVLFQYLKDGRSFTEPGICDVSIGSEVHQIGFRRVHKTQHPLYLGFAMGYCRHFGRWGELEAIQAFWPDESGTFPFEVACNSAVCRVQPRLDISLTPREIAEFYRQFE